MHTGETDPSGCCRIFNTGSPWNIPAGQGGANLDKLIAHYEKKNWEAEEAKVKFMREGKKGAGSE